MDETSDQHEAEIKLEIDAVGRSGGAVVTLRHAGKVIFRDQGKLYTAAVRDRIMRAIVAKVPTLMASQVNGIRQRLTEWDGRAQGDDAGDNSAGDRPDPQQLLAETPATVRAEAAAILNDPELLERVLADMAALDVAGESDLVMTVFLVGVSRLLPKPLAAIVQGPSSSGKSYTIDRTASLFPPESLLMATDLSAQALYYLPPGSLKHSFVVAGERARVQGAESADATKGLREMLSGGKLNKVVTVKIKGELQSVRIEQDGPIAYIESTTLSDVFEEDANRCLMLHSDERPEQTRNIIDATARMFAGASRADRDGIIARHHALQRMLQPLPVLVPYAERLGGMLSCERVEIRRGFTRLCAMIQAVALLHQRNRKRDPNGNLLAGRADYEIARRLSLGPVARLLEVNMSDGATRYFSRLERWSGGIQFNTPEAVARDMAAERSIRNWLKELTKARLVEVVETGKGQRATVWKLTGRRPNETANELLPTADEVFTNDTPF